MDTLSAAIAGTLTIVLAGIATATPEVVVLQDLPPARQITKPVVEDVHPTQRPRAASQTPIDVTPADLSHACRGPELPTDAASISTIPTWPSFHQSLRQQPKGRYTASYSNDPVLHGVESSLNSGNHVPWGGNVVPIVELLPEPGK